MTENQAMGVFFEIHDDIPRGGPGSIESTRRAFLTMTDIPKQPSILDVGCGPGMQTLDLASLTKGKIMAVDTHQPFLDRLNGTVDQQNLSERVTVLNNDMFSLNFDPETFDVIWAEGSIYIMGFVEALRAWKPMLRKSGYLAATHITWLRPDPPDDLRSYWAKEYPLIKDIETNLEIVRQCGYKLIAHFTLPESDWWDHYYTPIQQKLPALKEKYKSNVDALAVVQMEETEIEMYRKYASYYGYVFYVMQVY